MAAIRNSRLLHYGWRELLELHIDDDGVTYSRELLNMKDAVCVLPFDPQRQMITLVRQLRCAPLFKGEPHLLIEAPAGLIEADDTAEQTARREVEEETGLRVRNLRSLGRFWVSPGTMTERLTLFLAEYSPLDRVSSGGGVAHEHEKIEVIELPLTRAFDMLNAGEITDLKTLCLLQALWQPALSS